MKKTLLSIATMFFVNIALAQVVNEQVNFDNYISPTDNDLANKFSLNNPNFFTQSNSGGITGGVIIPPNYLSWGNDVVRYCSTYKNELNTLMETSISFKYNSALINPNAQERLAVIWLEGNDNHSIGFYLNRNILSVTAYNYAQSSNLSTLINGHWYKMATQYKSIGGNFGDQAYAKVEIFDLGMDGNGNPTSVGIHEANIYDAQLVNNTHFVIELAGAKWGGSEFLDNFTFSGKKFSNICNPLSTENINKEIKLSAYPIPTNKILNILNPKNGASKIEIFDTNGKLILNKGIVNSENTISLDVTNLPKGIYIYKIGDSRSKFIKN